MENVETVEIILENGESYEFKSSECSVVLGQVTENISNLGGRLFKTRVANKVNIVFHNNQNLIDASSNLAEQQNILEVVLINHLGDSEKYLVTWGDGDMDENSLQISYNNKLGNLVIGINN